MELYLILYILKKYLKKRTVEFLGEFQNNIQILWRLQNYTYYFIKSTSTFNISNIKRKEEFFRKISTESRSLLTYQK